MKKYNKYRLPPWVRQIRDLLKQFIVPFCLFQGIRTLFIPSIPDFLFLVILVLLAAAFHSDVI